jgi:hypothetical protein
MSVTKLHERLERIERAYFAALAGRDPETVPSSIWRAAIFAAVPDVSVEEIIEMFRWRARKLRGGGGSSFGSTDADLIKTLIDIGMCKDCAIRVVPLICTRAMAPEDYICSDKCVDALDRWAHPFGGSKPAPCLYPFQAQLDRMRARVRSREAAR